MNTIKTTHRIEAVDFKSMSDRYWNKYYEYYLQSHMEDFPTYPPETLEFRKIQMSSDNPSTYKYGWLVFGGQNQIIGIVGVAVYKEDGPEYEGQEHIAWVNYNVNKDYRKQGIGLELHELVISEVLKLNRNTIKVWTNNPDGKAVMEIWNGELTHRHFVNKLMLEDVDWSLMETWEYQGKERNPEVTLELFETVPEDDIEEYTQFYTEVYNQSPLDVQEVEVRVTPESRRELEKNQAKNGTIWITMIIREPHGEISGVTEIMYNPKDKEKIQQELTGVKEIHRGRGLGKWLKGAMILLARDRFPNAEFISTGNAMSNAPMLAINRMMGFKEVTVYHEYTFRLMTNLD